MYVAGIVLNGDTVKITPNVTTTAAITF
jgi:hypothetical protein